MSDKYLERKVQDPGTMLPEYLIAILKTLGGIDVPSYQLYAHSYKAGHHPSEVYECMDQMVRDGKVISHHKGGTRGQTRHFFYSLVAQPRAKKSASITEAN